MNSLRLILTFLTLLSALTASAQSQSKLSDMIQNSWGLRNLGEKQVFDLNPLQTYRLQARANEDIQLATPVIGKKVKVAVIDTGVDVNHPLLKDQIFKIPSECAALERYHKCVADAGIAGCTDLLVSGKDGFDQDQNKYPGDCHGWSILGDTTPENIIGTPDFTDDVGHGTHVAGIVASVSKNIQIVPIQVIGAAPNQPVKPFSLNNPFDPNPSENIRGGFSGDPNLAERIARGIIYAINAQVDVINLSIGWPQAQDHELMRQAVAEAVRRGIIVVAAAGNDATTALLRPCQYEGVICVAASRPDGSIAHFSNYGYGVDIAAPGASILSTVPENNRSIRLPGYSGIDILSGTSQASPFVAGVAAELLSRGIPSSEIYARLILGARPTQTELPVLVGPIKSDGQLKTSTEFNQKFVLSGLLDMKRSLNLTSQPLWLKANKDVHVIKWDGQSKILKFSFDIKNFWKNNATDKLSIQLKTKKSNRITPIVSKVNLINNKTVQVELAIVDQPNASRSELPSDLEFTAQTYLNNKPHTSFDVKAEVQVELNSSYISQNMMNIPIHGKLERGMKKYLVDEIYDQNQNSRDYIALSKEEKGFLISLVKYQNGNYSITPAQNINFEGKIQYTRPYSRIRMDIDGDRKSEYIIGIQEFKSIGESVNMNDYTMHFYIFNDQLKLMKHVAFYDARALISLDFTWIKVGQELRPAWVGLGKKVVTQYDVTDLWQSNPASPVDTKAADIHFYFLDENFKLAMVSDIQGYKIVDLVQAKRSDVAQGVIPVLLAKNKGTESKPSYLNDFALGWVSQGKVLDNQIKTLVSSSSLNYRNLVDTKKDKLLNLSRTSDEFTGTFWFGFDAHQKQRISMINFTNQSLYDQILPNDRSLFDSPLRIRAAFSGENSKGVFLITNTEIEYHDLTAQTTARSSLNKYTFFGSDLMVDLQFPITLTEQNGKTKRAALFTTEGSGLNKGVRFLVPTKIGESRNLQMVSPARLRLSAPQGCISIDSPIYINGDYYMDYDCNDKILRTKLVY